MKTNRLNMKTWLMAGGVLWALCCWAPSAPAQGISGTQYVPSRPTFSPYFGYFQVNTSGLPNYYAFVRPQQQFEQMVQRQSFQAGTARVAQPQQTGRIQLRPTAGLELREDAAGRTSRPATFMNYSHYYSTPASTGRRRR